VFDTSLPPPTTEFDAPGPVDYAGSVESVVAGRDDLRNFDEALQAWQLDDPGRAGVLRNPQGVTLFAPDDERFTQADVDAALANFDAFSLFLAAHLAVGAISSAEFGGVIITADGTTYPLSATTIGPATIVAPDLEATNGFVHVIDRPLATLIVPWANLNPRRLAAAWRPRAPCGHDRAPRRPPDGEAHRNTSGHVP